MKPTKKERRTLLRNLWIAVCDIDELADLPRPHRRWYYRRALHENRAVLNKGRLKLA